jgi:SEC-C motif
LPLIHSNLLKNRGGFVVREAQRNDPCPCGSGKKYKKCCMLKQRDLVTERVSRREGIQKSLAWISRHYRQQIDQWVEDVWLAGIDEEARQGIASADTQIRGIHDVNLLEQLVAEGSFSGMEGENRPLQLILAAEDLQLDDDQRNYLMQLGQRPLRLYRVSSCIPGESFTLDEYPLGKSEPATIEDKWASHMFDVGDTVGVRLMRSHDNWETSGAIYHVPEEHVADLLSILKKADKGNYSLPLIHYWLSLVAAHV